MGISKVEQLENINNEKGSLIINVQGMKLVRVFSTETNDLIAILNSKVFSLKEIVKILNNVWGFDVQFSSYHENGEMFEFVNVKVEEETENNGGSTDYYKLPAGATELQDLIEYKDMRFSVANIFKAAYRLGNCEHSDKARDLNKIIWFAKRELNRLKGE